MKGCDRIRQISSRDNPDYRTWLRLARGRAQHREARLLLQGAHLCKAWLDKLGLPDALIVSSCARALDWVADLWSACESTQRVILSDPLASTLSQVDHGPAVFFLVQTPMAWPKARLDRACLWLDRVQDPGNLGTLLRTAAAAGLTEAYLSSGCAAAWSSKALRSGQGAHFALTIYEQVDLHDLVAHLDIPLAATTLADATPLYSIDLRKPCAWLFGNEGRGVSDTLLQRAQWRIRIPQAGGVESLNVAAAAAICLFEQRRQQTAGHPLIRR